MVGGHAVGDSFASILKLWLEYQGYRNLTVYGYNGEILNVRMQFSDGSWHKITDIGIGGEAYRRLASERVAF
jgi:hypothetical protein